MAPQDVVDEFNRYVLNDIPKRLIYIRNLPEMELVDRNFVMRHFEKDINEITEDTIDCDSSYLDEPWDKSEQRERIIRSLPAEVVQYAILSHRWLDEGEPTYKMIAKKHATKEASSPGYQKLLQFCEEAQRRGFEFAWSDTCCIDKASSAELDEAIRSMFRWYRNSSLCIVHLAQTTGIEDLEGDEWLKRGWTLQELLAPHKIKFFNKSWEPLTERENDKVELDDEQPMVLGAIERATGIPYDTISAFFPSPCKVDERMTWAAKRTTTRGEDVAYSLMGIFDVSLQIAYGENADRAFSRLIEAIMLAGGDASVLNWAGKPADHYASRGLPRSPASYVGHPRNHDMYIQLDMALTSRGLRVPLIILPLKIIDKGKKNHPNASVLIEDVEFYCSLFGLGYVSVHIRVAADSDVFCVRFDEQCALGVINYIPPSEDNNMYTDPLLPKKMVGYLLQRRTKVSQGQTPVSGRMFKRWNDFESSYTHRWNRIPTAFVTVDLPLEADFKATSFSDLKMIYL